MSKDETGSDEARGLPGYPANNSIPSGFALPIPMAPAPEHLDEPEPADPWSSTWEDTSWHVNADSDESTNDAPVADDVDLTAAGTASADGTDWTDSYEFGGEYAADYGQLARHDDSAGVVTSGTSGINGHSTTEPATNWESWASPGDSTEGDTHVSTSHWADRQHDADVSDASQEEYSGWTPAGYASDDVAPTIDSTDHTAAQQAYAARPAVDPDVAAASAESASVSEPSAYDAAPASRGGSSDRPSAEDLITARSKGERQKVKANSGLRKAFGLGPSVKELLERDRVDRIARPLNGRKTIMVINTKGGGGKTLVTMMLASYLGRYRSGSVLAWDNNETEGTLGMRAPSQPHHRTVVDLLAALPQIARDPNAGTSELEHWVREQRGLSFDVLASADDDEAMRIIGEQEFEDLHSQLSRFYRMIVVDTGNNRLSPNWLAAAARADLLVFATSLKDDTSVVAAKNLDALVTMGRGDLVRNAVCVISHTSAKGNDVGAGVHTREHFEQWVRAVVDIPYDPMLSPGLHLDPLKIAKKTHEACMEMAAVVVDGL
ncbi:MinD/ParA family protein [Humibacillus xanthopallidus]|uniref:MinD/ParA family ATP-binding protein n=1 Tax=Humibacillus xanthopallidus TaxID=412689 RepID=UPI00384E96A7